MVSITHAVFLSSDWNMKRTTVATGVAGNIGSPISGTIIPPLPSTPRTLLGVPRRGPGARRVLFTGIILCVTGLVLMTVGSRHLSLEEATTRSASSTATVESPTRRRSRSGGNHQPFSRAQTTTTGSRGVNGSSLIDHHRIPGKSARGEESYDDVRRVVASYRRRGEEGASFHAEGLRLTRRAIRHSWLGYRRSAAFGFDEFFPISGVGSNWGGGRGIGVTIVDALDTLMLAGLEAEAIEALQWIETELSFEQATEVSLFETTIRVLGGLLSAHQLLVQHGVRRPRLLALAFDLGERLAHAFDTESGLPDNYIGLVAPHEHHRAAWNGYRVILAEAGSLQMEFATLAALTNRSVFAVVSRRAIEIIRPSCVEGFCPRFYEGCTPNGGTVGLGSFGDSFYEYLLKMWLLTNRTDDMYLDMWQRAEEHIVSTSRGNVGGGRYFIPNGVETLNTMEHLACYSGGLFALSHLRMSDGVRPSAVFHRDKLPPNSKCGGQDRTTTTMMHTTKAAIIVGKSLVVRRAEQQPHRAISTRHNATPGGRGRGEGPTSLLVGEGVVPPSDVDELTATAPPPRVRRVVRPNERLQTAAAIAETCHAMYNSTATQLSGDVVRFLDDGQLEATDAKYILRPETMETYFYLWRTTRDPKYRQWGLDLLVTIETLLRVDTGGYVGISSVESTAASRIDHMESFWVAETLKYALLLFSEDDLLDLEEWVLNTEAHPLRVMNSSPAVMIPS